MKTKSFELLGVAGLLAGLVLSQGCRTTYSEQASAEDLSLRPMPESLTPEATGDIVPQEAPAAKELPYWKQVQQQGGADADPYATALDTEKAPSTVPGAPSFTSYVVKKGDTISHIAVRYGLRWQDVAAVNSGLNPNRLRVGQVIRLPGSIDLSKPRHGRKSSRTVATPSGKGSVYIVKKNDILGRIAIAHGVRISDIKKANNLKSDFIREGQKLVIPARGAAVKSSASASKSKARKNVSKPVVAPPPPPVQDVVPSVAPVAPEENLGIEPPVAPPPVTIAPPVAPPVVSTGDIEPPDFVKESTESAPDAPKSASTYRVQEGEDLYEIAIRWGVSTDIIRKLNPGCADKGGKLVPGTVLKIPGGSTSR